MFHRIAASEARSNAGSNAIGWGSDRAHACGTAGRSRCRVDPDEPSKGGRWIVRTETGERYPLTLSTLLFDSSGTNKDAARQEHRDAIRAVIAGAESVDADPFAVACALDWLLYDFLMAHRDGPDSAAIVLGKGQEADAELIVAATAASVAARAMVDPGLVLQG